MTKRTNICCPLCRRRMSPYYPAHLNERQWICTKCELVLRIEQMPWYPLTYISDEGNRKIMSAHTDEESGIRFIEQTIADTSVPKTYRASFEQYLKWREKR